MPLLDTLSPVTKISRLSSGVVSRPSIRNMKYRNRYASRDRYQPGDLPGHRSHTGHNPRFTRIRCIFYPCEARRTSPQAAGIMTDADVNNFDTQSDAQRTSLLGSSLKPTYTRRLATLSLSATCLYTNSRSSCGALNYPAGFRTSPTATRLRANQTFGFMRTREYVFLASICSFLTITAVTLASCFTDRRRLGGSH
jgi:hypothetical protein